MTPVGPRGRRGFFLAGREAHQPQPKFMGYSVDRYTMSDLTLNTTTSLTSQPERPTQNPALLYLAQQTESGRRSQLSALRRIARMFGSEPETMDWTQIPYDLAQLVKSRLRQDGLKPATINRILSALRGVVREAWRCGLVDHEHYARVSDVANEKNHVLPPGRALERAESSKLLAAFDSARDRAILAAMVHGLRRTEVCGLTVADVTPSGLRVRGKGGKERLVPYVGSAGDLLTAWMRAHARPEPDAPLFYRVDRYGNHNTSRGLTGDAVYKILQAGAQRAGIASVKPHDLRRTFCTSALRAGVGIDVVAHVAGHASVDTTRRYDRSQDDRAHEQMRALDLL